MKQIQVLFQTPILLNTAEEWRYYEKCFQLNIVKENLKITGKSILMNKS
jgi:hypothetical protein